jgi:hypothetical protein
VTVEASVVDYGVVPPEGGRVLPGIVCVPVLLMYVAYSQLLQKIGGGGREKSVGFFTLNKRHVISRLSPPPPQKRDCGSFQSLASTGRIGFCASRSDEAEASVNKTTPVPITPREPVVTQVIPQADLRKLRA